MSAPFKLGDFVQLTKPGLNGPVKIAGTIVRITPKGIEVRTQQDGYHTVAAEALTLRQPRQKRIVSHAAVASDAFLESYEWRRVRMVALKKHGTRCQCCGATPADGAVMHVDHIKPRKVYPELALDVTNLQVLCHECNHGKGNWDMTDWRPSSVETT